MSFKNDYSFGSKVEIDVMPLLSNKFGDIRQLDKYSRFDYEGDNILIELKSRRNTKDKYPTTMISQSKIDYLKKTNKRGVFCFQFTDGLYSIEYSDIFNGFSVGQGGRWDRGRPEINQYCYIPVGLLEKIEQGRQEIKNK